MNGFIRFFNTYIPVERCNLRCHYCYIGQKNRFNETAPDGELRYSIEHIRECVRPERLGGICFFNLCAGGETLLYKDLQKLTEMFLDLGHYVGIVTNATLEKPLRQLIAIPIKLREKLFLKCSFQYMEMKKRNLLDTFFGNIELLKQNSISFSVEITSNDQTIPLIPEINDVCMQKLGVLPHVVESRTEQAGVFPRLTKLPLNEHQSAWGGFESELFQFQQYRYERYQPKFCYAGVYGMALILKTGECYQCNGAKKFTNLFESPNEPIKFVAVGANCPLKHCFLRYVWVSMCGCYPDEKAPRYSTERNRICNDGSSWLTPLIDEAYSRRCSEFHTPYSEEKAFFIDLLMRKVYKKQDPSEEEKSRLTHIVSEAMLNKSIRKIAIYGMGTIGKWLVGLLADSKVEVVCAIDRRWSEICSDFPAQSPDMVIDGVDAVIVSVYSEFTNIAPMLREKNDVPVLSIVELLD